LFSILLQPLKSALDCGCALLAVAVGMPHRREKARRCICGIMRRNVPVACDNVSHRTPKIVAAANQRLEQRLTRREKEDMARSKAPSIHSNIFPMFQCGEASFDHKKLRKHAICELCE
jgi:hypothetical protein